MIQFPHTYDLQTYIIRSSVELAKQKKYGFMHIDLK